MSFLKKKIFFLLLKMFTQPMKRIENLELFESEHLLECYGSVKKGVSGQSPSQVNNQRLYLI